MRVAIAHDFLCQRGGAERVVLYLASILDNAFIVTSVHSPEATYPELASVEVRASRVVGAERARRFRRHVLSYPGVFRSADLSDADFVIVSSSAFAHHVHHERSVVYWHTPPRFLYDPGAYLPVRRGSLMDAFASRGARVGLAPLRRSDGRAARAHLGHAANSERTAAKLRAVYGIEPAVLHPPLDTGRLAGPLSPLPASPRALVVSRLLPYKGVDVAIAACRQLELPLTVVGIGPDEGRLRSLAGGTADFAGTLSDDELAAVFRQSSVVLCPGADDFGYIPLEAGFCGRPVVALRGSGAAESVIAGETGELVDGWDEASWSSAVRGVLDSSWDPERLRIAASRFDGASFCAAFAEWISEWVDLSEVLSASALGAIQHSGSTPEEMSKSSQAERPGLRPASPPLGL